MRKNVLLNVLLSIVVVIGAFTAAEVLFRKLLFSGAPLLEKFRKQDYFADYFSEDYKKLRILFDQMTQPDRKQHPVLGWSGDFDGGTYLHWNAADLKGRRPVLLYGDSFGICNRNDAIVCFQDLLNRDEIFSKDHYLLNYSQNGYGVDQIYLAIKHSAGLYQDPFVVFSLMTLDLDRVLLKLRAQTKPHFELHGDELIYHPPSPLTRREYVEKHPPGIRSYLWNFAWFSVRSLAQKHWPWLYLKMKSRPGYRESVMELSSRILSEAFRELRDRGVDFVVLVFQPDWKGESSVEEHGWREGFLRQLLDEHAVPYIWMQDVLLEDAGKTGRRIREYFLEDGHPAPVYNEIVSELIKASALASSAKEPQAAA